MIHAHSAVETNACLLKIGTEIFRVYGDEQSGWSVDPGDLHVLAPAQFRYGSIEELFFALVNLNLSVEGSA